MTRSLSQPGRAFVVIDRHCRHCAAMVTRLPTFDRGTANLLHGGLDAARIAGILLLSNEFQWEGTLVC
ncbi:hypothetical protein [Nocardia sp. XZ_19_369]|uniref:hypothetical protein n=1 Tax=Nocardia sp. XZ_19_369 TaxID=2769487 RepID=UPI00188DD557|nr:hypothetical protein [Nocardia sp. XZ_19_369]